MPTERKPLTAGDALEQLARLLQSIHDTAAQLARNNAHTERPHQYAWRQGRLDGLLDAVHMARSMGADLRSAADEMDLPVLEVTPDGVRLGASFQLRIVPPVDGPLVESRFDETVMAGCSCGARWTAADLEANPGAADEHECPLERDTLRPTGEELDQDKPIPFRLVEGGAS